MKMPAFINRFRKVPAFLDSILWLPFLLNGIWIAFIIIWHLNLTEVDLSGHLASAVSFFRGQYHSFHDQFFNGYIHGLFYPPLEEFVLSSMYSVGHFLFNASWVEIYKTYLVLIVFLYLFSIWFLIKHFKQRITRLFLTYAFLYLLNIEKPDLLTLQGLSMMDVWITGLTSQILSGIFFFLLIREILFRQREKTLILYLFLIIASHIVNGLVAILLVFLKAIIGPQRKMYIRTLGFACLLTCFFWMPVIGHHSWMVSSKIWRAPFMPEFLILSAISLIIFCKNRTASIFLLSSSVMFFSSEALYFFNMEYFDQVLAKYIPHFHYYRLAMPALMLLFVGLACVFDDSVEKVQKNWKILSFGLPKYVPVSIIVIILFGITFYNLDFKRYDFSWEDLQKSTFDFHEAKDLSFPEYGRFLVLGKERSIDNGLDSILTIESENFRSTKGLYWESSRDHTLQSSYLATLFHPPSVLDYYYYKNYSCSIQKCFLNAYFRTFNVRGVVGNPDLISYTASEAQLSCYKEIFKDGTGLYRFDKKGTVWNNKDEYDIYHLIPEQNASDYIDTVEPISLRQVGLLNPYIENNYVWQQQAMQDVHHSCIVRPDLMPLLTYWLTPSDLKKFSGDWEAVANENLSVSEISPSIGFQKISKNEYLIHLPDDAIRPYVVKFSYQPGMYFEDAKGNTVPSFQAYPNTLILSKGETRLKIRKTIWMKTGYFLSSIGLILYLGIYWIFKPKTL